MKKPKVHFVGDSNLFTECKLPRNSVRWLIPNGKVTCKNCLRVMQAEKRAR